LSESKVSRTRTALVSGLVVAGREFRTVIGKPTPCLATVVTFGLALISIESRRF
jgi:hypothetical protein